MDFRFDLLAEVKDTITGFTGVVVGRRHRTDWFNGCVRYGVQGKTLHEGIPKDPVWFDEQQLVLVEPAPVRKTEGTGGPMPDPNL